MPTNWDKLKELFTDAAELPAPERPAFLDRKCAGDAELREAVERLLDQTGETATQDLLPVRARRSLSPGNVLSGRFRIVRFAGAGGMGEVYEAEDLELGGRVAVKTLHPGLLDDPRFLTRFRREVQLARQVTHSNICRIFDVANDQGRVYLTMEFLEGETLGTLLRRQGKLSPDAALPVARHILEGLAALHEHGVVHRDLKPGNVILAQSSQGRRAVISDFGLARALTHTDEGASLSSTGQLLGTPDYMSPEQLRGEPASPASDLYALGLVLYEMVTGKKAYPGGRGIENAVQRVFEAPTPPRQHEPDLPPHWEAAILRCLERDPGRRPGSATAVLDEISGSAVLPKPPVSRRTGLFATAGIFLTVLAAFFAGSRATNRGDGPGLTLRSQLAPKLQVSGLPAGTDITLVLVRAAGEKCADSVAPTGLQIPADGQLELASHVQPGCWCSGGGATPNSDPLAGLAVMAENRAVTYVGAGELCRKDPVPIQMRPRHEVTVVVHSPDARLQTYAADDVAYTDWVFNRQRAGIALRPRFLPIDPATKRLNCETVEKYARHEPKVVNLYFGVRGLNLSCGGSNSAVFVHDAPTLGDTTHELAHKLGINSRDHIQGLRVESGHVTGEPGFSCNNTMWNLSDLVQDELTPGQVFRLNTGCSSFVPGQSQCLPCAERRGMDSPCPPYSLGTKPDPPRCGACSLEQALAIADASALSSSEKRAGRSQFCDRDELRKALAERFAELSVHVGTRPELTLGPAVPNSLSLDAFVERWVASIGTVLAVESVARLTNEAQRKNGIARLREFATSAPEEFKEYLFYGARNIERDPNYRPRCGAKN